MSRRVSSRRLPIALRLFPDTGNNRNRIVVPDQSSRGAVLPPEPVARASR